MIPKIVFLSLISLQVASTGFAQDQNPFESIGKKGHILTLSEGKYDESFEKDSLERIGTVLVNRYSRKIERFLDEYSKYDKISDNIEPSRFLSVDPMTSKFAELSPYQYASNRPIDGTDLDGLEFVSTFISTQYSKLQGEVQFHTTYHGPTFSTYDPSKQSLTQSWRDSKNLIAQLTYNMANGIYTFPQQLTADIRGSNFVYNISGNAYNARGIQDEKQRVDNFVNFGTLLIPGVSAEAKTEEILGETTSKILTNIENKATQQVAEKVVSETGFRIEGQLSKIWEDRKLFSNWIKNNQSLERIGNPLNQTEAQQLINNAKKLGITEFDNNLKGLEGLEKTGQWGNVPHFKIGSVHIPIKKGIGSDLKF